MRTPTNERLTSDIVDDPRAAGAAPAESRPAKTQPERRCILSGDHGGRDALVRLAISPPDADGVCQVLPDPLAKAPGRGAWIGTTRAELEQAIAKGRLRAALARAFKGAPLAVPGDLPQRIEAGLERALLDRLGLELRAGNLVLGSDRIAEACRAGAVDALLHTSDASDDGSRKLDQAWRVGRDTEGSGEAGLTLPLDRAALSVALGRDNVVHLALADPAAADRVMQTLQRLLHYLGGPSSDEDATAPTGGEPDSRHAATND